MARTLCASMDSMIRRCYSRASLRCRDLRALGSRPATIVRCRTRRRPPRPRLGLQVLDRSVAKPVL